MKFKHLLLASVFVFSFASCSDDNAPKEIEYKDFEAHLSISAIPMNEVTKASSVEDGKDETGTVNEQFVQTLTAYVFNASDGSYAGMGTATATADKKTVDRIENILVKVKAEKAGDISTESKFKVILLANVTPESTPANLSDLKFFKGIEKYSFDEVKKGSESLPMGSEVFEIGSLVAGKEYNNWVKKGTTNTIEYTEQQSNKKLTPSNNSVAGVTPGEVYTVAETDRIALTRYVARVQLESLGANFTSGNENAEFKLTKVHLANVSNASKFIGDSFQYVIGSENEGIGYYDESDAFMRGVFDFKPVDHYLASGTTSKSLTKSYESGIVIKNGTSNVAEFNDATLDTDNDASPEMAQFYAFELDGFKMATGKGEPSKDATSEIHTSLILEGEWTNAGVLGAKRYFRIPIKHSTDVNGVKRNYIYKVNATLTGEGTDNPDKSLLNAFVSFSISVQDWQVKKQVEDDVN